ncbi:YfiR family protein [Vibrio renipiscarius]|uniref:Valyl-tRNA synthetase n=1 Tax=Vibrio renipiscarius TaxID=1461322 RepID=A0A0C2NQQ8_9VIBR|nr:YfiR family protein [Vibrio renipiscarius]KII76507.1 valyl-tRNA synthetase [Vibrio renipiscarius]KII77971.1 valyl-tRNA synthetase [Vibrio renipiscarius]
MIQRFLQRFCSRLTLVLGLLFFSHGVLAKYGDEDLMAVYLYRFALMSDWQETGVATSPLEFCVTESSDVADRLEKIVLSKPEMATYNNIAQNPISEICHVLYVGDTNEAQIAQLKMDYPHALLVGSGKAFIQCGGMIAFVKVNNRIKPMISRKNVASSQIKLRSQLLSIAILANEAES